MSKKREKINFTNTEIAKLTPENKTYRVWAKSPTGLCLMISPKGTLTYYVSYTIPGTRERRDYKLGRHGPVTPDMARKEAKVQLGKVAAGIDIQADKMSDRQNRVSEKARTLEGFIKERYEPWALQHKKRGEEDLERVKRLFDKWLPLPLKDISVRRVTEWQTLQLKNGRQPSGINRDVNSLRGILSKAVEFEVIADTPLRKLKKLKIDKSKRVRFLCDDEEIRLRNALDKREKVIHQKRQRFNQWLVERGKEPIKYPKAAYADHIKPIVLLALNTGMRIGEVFNLKWGDINWNKRRPSLAVVGDGSKNGQTRHIPLSAESLYILKHWQKQSSHPSLVFPSPKTGERLDNINSAWTAVRKDADLYHPQDDGQHFRFHDLRHTFASNLVMAGIDLNQIREFLGHESIEMTLKYAHLAPENSAAAISVLNERITTLQTKASDMEPINV